MSNLCSRSTGKNCLTRFIKLITTAVKHCYFAVEQRVVLLPYHHCSNAIHQFACHNNSWHVNGRTFQRLKERIKQHIYKSVTKLLPSRSHGYLSRPCKVNSSSRHCLFQESPLARIFLKTRSDRFVRTTIDSLILL